MIGGSLQVTSEKNVDIHSLVETNIDSGKRMIIAAQDKMYSRAVLK